MKPRVIILSGYGLNCEDETAFAFTLAKANADIVHVNDLVESPKLLDKYQILAIPGGFSYGDDTGSGKAYANKLKNHLEDALRRFADSDKLMIGICNGFQILTQAGLLPGALIFNDFPRYTVRWTDIKVMPLDGVIARSQTTKQSDRSKKIASDALAMTKTLSPWLNGIKHLSLPIAHGEGKFYANNKTLAILKKQGQIAAEYEKGEICKMQNLPANPNGSLLDIAAITAYEGRVLGIMPHPERAVFFNQLPHWTLLKEQMARAGKKMPGFGPGLRIFENAVKYFK